jgi:hypothetical protein
MTASTGNENEDFKAKPHTDTALPAVRPVSHRPVDFVSKVDGIVSALWPDKKWRAYLDAITNRSSITGKWEIDRGFAAKGVVEEAKRIGVPEVSEARLTKVMRAVETLLRRDDLGRKQRLLASRAAPEAPQAAE